VSSAAGLSLLAQPAAFTCSVSRIGFVSAMEAFYKERKKKSCGIRIFRRLGICDGASKLFTALSAAERHLGES
jgi:hypothetical protein